MGEFGVMERNSLNKFSSLTQQRLDAIHMIGDAETAMNNAEHVRQIRKTIRSERPDALCMGEHFHEVCWVGEGNEPTH